LTLKIEFGYDGFDSKFRVISILREVRMKKALIFVSALVLLTLVGGCTTFKASGLEFHGTPSQGDFLGGFDIKVTSHRFLGFSAGPTLFNISQDSTDPKVTEAIRKEISSRGGTAAINIQIEQQASALQVILNAITWSIYAPVTLHITGSVIK
jgi:hypothetical protein